MVDGPSYASDVLTRVADYLGLRLFVIHTQPVDAEREVALIADHLDHQVELERRGVMFSAGPLRDADGTRVAGLVVIRAGSFEEAKQIADSDPMHREGARTYSLHEWTVNEGGFDLRVRFSDQSMHIR
jgi:uncharacterized protein YciI